MVNIESSECGRGRIVGRGQINMLKMNIQFISLQSAKKNRQTEHG